MFFARPGEYEPCGVFSWGHLLLLLLTIILIKIAVDKTDINNKKTIKNKIIIITILAWILEIIKIIFNIKVGNGNNLNTYIPLYYCSILLYAGIFSSIGKGKIKRIGDVFLATGGLIAGCIFLILPTTSLATYPIFHFLSIHSFIYHGAMIYLGIIIHKSNYVEINKHDILYYAGLVGVMCFIAFIINNIFDSNLMFISKDFPHTVIGLVYRLTGKYFSIFMTITHMVLPFYVVLGVKKLINIRLVTSKKVFNQN